MDILRLGSIVALFVWVLFFRRQTIQRFNFITEALEIMVNTGPEEKEIILRLCQEQNNLQRQLEELQAAFDKEKRKGRK